MALHWKQAQEFASVQVLERLQVCPQTAVSVFEGRCIILYWGYTFKRLLVPVFRCTWRVSEGRPHFHRILFCKDVSHELWRFQLCMLDALIHSLLPAFGQVMQPKPATVSGMTYDSSYLLGASIDFDYKVTTPWTQAARASDEMRFRHTVRGWFLVNFNVWGNPLASHISTNAQPEQLRTNRNGQMETVETRHITTTTLRTNNCSSVGSLYWSRNIRT